MTSHFRLIAFALSSLFLVSAGFGQSVKVEGDVKGVNNKAANGADVRVDRVDKKAAPVMAKTDAKGHFAATVLDVGTYKLTATLPGGLQSARVITADTSITHAASAFCVPTLVLIQRGLTQWLPWHTPHVAAYWSGATIASLGVPVACEALDELLVSADCPSVT